MTVYRILLIPSTRPTERPAGERKANSFAREGERKTERAFLSFLFFFLSVGIHSTSDAVHPIKVGH